MTRRRDNNFYAALEELAHLSRNWDTYGAEPPAKSSLYWAKEAIRVLRQLNFPPSRIDPSAEGGVTISFAVRDKCAHIECFNTGEIVGAMWVRGQQPDVWEIAGASEDLESSANRIRTFMAL